MNVNLKTGPGVAGGWVGGGPAGGGEKWTPGRAEGPHGGFGQTAF